MKYDRNKLIGTLRDKSVARPLAPNEILHHSIQRMQAERHDKKAWSYLLRVSVIARGPTYSATCSAGQKCGKLSETASKSKTVRRVA